MPALDDSCILLCEATNGYWKRSFTGSWDAVAGSPSGSLVQLADRLWRGCRWDRDGGLTKRFPGRRSLGGLMGSPLAEKST